MKAEFYSLSQPLIESLKNATKEVWESFSLEELLLLSILLGWGGNKNEKY